MNNISMLIKPASGKCNMRCHYCFYHSLTEKRSVKDYGIMSKETLRQLVQRAFEGASESITFAFQGGEPSVAGLDFFYQFEEYVALFNVNHIEVNRAFQTNGYVIDETWCEYFKKYGYLVGLSLDGPKELHDLYRVDNGDKGTFDKAMRAKNLFDQYKVEYNALCVVSRELARYGKKVYDFFKSEKIRYMQFIPCLDDLYEKQGSNEYSLTPRRYLKFLKDTFDAWYEDVRRNDLYVIRQFDNYIGMLLGYPPESCNMKGHCSCQFVVEADGSVYPCDFYVVDEYRLGNLYDHSLQDLFESDVTKKFIGESMNHHEKCVHCKWYQLCRNGCRRERQKGLNEYCEAYYNFFNYAYDRMADIAKRTK